MPNKNFDGIAKTRPAKMGAAAIRKRQILRIDAVSLYNAPKPLPAVREELLAPSFIVPFKPRRAPLARTNLMGRIYRQKRVSVIAAALAVVLAFSGGMWAALTTYKTSAEVKPEVLGALASQSDTSTQQASAPQLAGLQLQAQTSAGDNILFNTPLENLQSYLAAIAQPDVIEQRARQLQEYLTAKKSPLVAAAAVIAEQDHWKLILAIAFAESSLGKNCSDNNCSNIGSRPGAPTWRQYPSYQGWVVDFNYLLDKKYKDQTLAQMCGVYVQPCNPNWLLATQEILSELKQQGIN